MVERINFELLIFFFLTLSMQISISIDSDGTQNEVENILGKGENAGYKHFLLFP